MLNLFTFNTSISRYYTEYKNPAIDPSLLLLLLLPPLLMQMLLLLLMRACVEMLSTCC